MSPFRLEPGSLGDVLGVERGERIVKLSEESAVAMEFFGKLTIRIGIDTGAGSLRDEKDLGENH